MKGNRQEGNLLTETEFPFADAHGQYRFNYRHPYFKGGEEETFLLDAFRRDFEVNGPSLLRLIRVLLNGWQTSRLHSRPRSGASRPEAAPLRSTYAGAVWAMKRHYRLNPQLRECAGRLLADMYAAFGWRTRLIAPLIGRFVYSRLKKRKRVWQQAIAMNHVPSVKKMRQHLPWKWPLPPSARPARGRCRPWRNRPGDSR